MWITATINEITVITQLKLRILLHLHLHVRLDSRFLQESQHIPMKQTFGSHTQEVEFGTGAVDVLGADVIQVVAAHRTVSGSDEPEKTSVRTSVTNQETTTNELAFLLFECLK